MASRKRLSRESWPGGKIPPDGALIALAVFAVVINGYYLLIVRRGGEKDERTIKLNSRVTVYSWLLPFYVTVLLMGSDTPRASAPHGCAGTDHRHQRHVLLVPRPDLRHEQEG